MLTVETAVIHLFILIVPIATEKVRHIWSNIIWNRWKSTLRGKIHMSEPKPGKGNQTYQTSSLETSPKFFFSPI